MQTSAVARTRLSGSPHVSYLPPARRPLPARRRRWEGRKELESLAWRQFKPTVLAWEAQTSDAARPIDVEAHVVDADSSQLTPQLLAHLGGAPHRPTRWHETFCVLAVSCGH